MRHIFTVTAAALSLIAISQNSLVSANEPDGSFRFHKNAGVSALPTRTRQPQLGAAHALSLTTDLHRQMSDTERDQIRRLGPWLTEGAISHNAQVLIRFIQDARVHGLNPETYQLSRILRTVDLLSHLDKNQPAESTNNSSYLQSDEAALRFTLNDLLDSSFITLANHLGQGVVDGRALQRRLYRDAPKIKAFNMLVSISSAELSVAEALSSVVQSHPEYIRLTKTMRNLLTERSTGIARTQVAASNNAQLISQANDKQSIRERLLETGDLSFEAYAAPNIDAELLKALRAFQARNGLEQNSFADEKTRAALNKGVDDDMEAVALSLERWRWLPRELGDRHVFVNIPDYRVKVVENNVTKLSMPAVVGKFKHQTPSFSRDMSYMEYNPTWTVPASIANKELVPKERRSPGYLVSRDFDFLKRVGNRLVKVPADTVTPEELNSARFPYVLRQRGGPINALGRMKFMMPNQYAIYLHDTQAKKHFTLNDRAYSHGCIRLGDPDALAQLLMSSDGYSDEKIAQSMRSTKTHRIRFRQPVPTHLVYFTTWVDENNILQSRPDIYRHDAKLLTALHGAGTLLSKLTTSSL